MFHCLQSTHSVTFGCHYNSYVPHFTEMETLTTISSSCSTTPTAPGLPLGCQSPASPLDFQPLALSIFTSLSILDPTVYHYFCHSFVDIIKSFVSLTFNHTFVEAPQSRMDWTISFSMHTTGSLSTTGRSHRSAWIHIYGHQRSPQHYLVVLLHPSGKHALCLHVMAAHTSSIQTSKSYLILLLSTADLASIFTKELNTIKFTNTHAFTHVLTPCPSLQWTKFLHLSILPHAPWTPFLTACSEISYWWFPPFWGFNLFSIGSFLKTFKYA